MTDAIDKKKDRLKKIKEVLKEIGKKGQNVGEQHFIAQASIALGCTPHKIKEYLRELIVAGYIEIKGGDIVWIAPQPTKFLGAPKDMMILEGYLRFKKRRKK
jgi:predicted transcriptional regulator